MWHNFGAMCVCDSSLFFMKQGNEMVISNNQCLLMMSFFVHTRCYSIYKRREHTFFLVKRKFCLWTLSVTKFSPTLPKNCNFSTSFSLSEEMYDPRRLSFTHTTPFILCRCSLYFLFTKIFILFYLLCYSIFRVGAYIFVQQGTSDKMTHCYVNV